MTWLPYAIIAFLALSNGVAFGAYWLAQRRAAAAEAELIQTQIKLHMEEAKVYVLQSVLKNATKTPEEKAAALDACAAARERELVGDR